MIRFTTLDRYIGDTYAEITGSVFPNGAVIFCTENTRTYVTESGTFKYPADESGGDKYPFEARLTLESGVPFSSSAQTAKTELFLTPYKGDQIALCNDSAIWFTFTLTELTIKATDAQSGTTHNGTKVIDGLTDTSQLVVGMQITGTNVGVASVIASIDSATQITGTVNSTGDGTTTITFKLPASTVYDVFVFNNSGTPKLEFLAWTNSTTRATALLLQEGIDVKTGQKSRRYAGTIVTTATAGQLEDSLTYHSIDNAYNCDEERPIGIWDTTDSWTYNTASFRSWNNSTASRVTFVIGKPHKLVTLIFACYVFHTLGGSNNVRIGIGLDSVTVDSSSMRAPIGSGTATATYKERPGIGLHYLQLLERGNGAATCTYYGDNGTVDRSGAVGYING